MPPDLNLTPVVFKFADYVLEPGSPGSTHTFALLAAKDTYDVLVSNLTDEIAYIRGLQHVETKCPETGETTRVKLTKMFTGDLPVINSCQGLSTCSSSNPCGFCLIARNKLGDLAGAAGHTAKNGKGESCKKYPLRTLAMQNGLSHGVLGAFCAVCNKKVDQAMVDAAQRAYEDPVEKKAHRLSHFGYVSCIFIYNYMCVM